MRQIRLFDPTAIEGDHVIKARDVETLGRADEVLAATLRWRAQEESNWDQMIKAARTTATLDAYQTGLATFVAAADAYNAKAQSISEDIETLVGQAVYQVLSAWPAKDILRAALVPVMAELRLADDVVFAIHPSQAGDLEEVIAALRKEGKGTTNFSIERTEELPEGDCQIYTSSAVIKISISLLTENIMAAFAPKIAAMKSRHSVLAAPAHDHATADNSNHAEPPDHDEARHE